MISFDPHWGGLDYVQETPPGDGLGIIYLPSIAHDSTAGQLQLESEASVHSFMQLQFRAVTENMYGSGLIISAGV